MAKILVLNGPNLNLLGTREPGHYGHQSLKDIIQTLTTEANELGHQLEHFQSNAEHELVDQVHQSVSAETKFILINPAAFTHTSVALRDALLAVAVPFIEIHLSNVHAREDFREVSYFSDIALGVISGLGPQSYSLALKAAHEFLQEQA